MRLTKHFLPVAAAFAPATAIAGLGDTLNMPRGVTPISQEAYDLHMLILWICVAIGVVVFGAMFYSILAHRKSLGVEPARFHHSTKAEILWTVVPCLILVGMAIPATKALVAMEDTSEADMTIKVTGYQWNWRYQYLDKDVTIYSSLAPESRAAIHGGDPATTPNYLLDVDNPLVIPAGKKVRLLLTSNDVIHAWWVPDFGMKKDAIPGFINEMWIRVEEPGVYRGQCAELCGKDHGFMPIVVEVKSQAEYESWLAQQAGGEAADTRRAGAADTTSLAATAVR
jgi:cytochrome c oxidase subunit 2